MARTTDQRGDALTEGRIPQLPGAEPMDLRNLGFLSERDPLDLSRLMRHLLVGVEETTKKTWAQRLIEAWIIDALEGNARAIEEILVQCKTTHDAGNKTADGQLAIGDDLAGRILEVLCDSGCDETCT